MDKERGREKEGGAGTQTSSDEWEHHGEVEIERAGEEGDREMGGHC